MLNSICDILIFKTVFEDEKVFKTKFKKILEMFDTYLSNSGLELENISKENEIFDIIEYFDDNLGIKIIYSIQKKISNKNYFPVGIINFYIDEAKFEKSNIESFLNDNVKFIYNVFFEDFFIDFDHEKYDLLDYNKGKKINYENLNKFNTENPFDNANKQLLDSMMYIYFNLIKNIFDIKSNSDYINNNLVSQTLEKDFEAKLVLFQKRGDEVKHNLTIQAVKVKQQIDTFINFIS